MLMTRSEGRDEVLGVHLYSSAVNLEHFHFVVPSPGQ